MQNLSKTSQSLTNNNIVSLLSARSTNNTTDTQSENDTQDNFSTAQIKKLKQIPAGNDIHKYYKFNEAEDELGQGSYGWVYRATQANTGLKCALKMVEKDYDVNSQYSEYLKNEIKLLEVVNHPKIMRVHQLLEDDAYYYIAAELCNGGDLKGRLNKAKRFKEKDASHVIRQTLQAVNYMHNQNMMHRDLKPDNILIEDKTSLNIKLADFGLSCFVDTEFIIDNPGTAQYCAPEVWDMKYNKQADVYSLGVISFELLTGSVPIGSFQLTDDEMYEEIKSTSIEDQIKKYCRKVSENGKDFLSKALCKDPTLRWTCSQLLQHPWITNHSPDTELDIELGNQIMTNIQSFADMEPVLKNIISTSISFTELDQSNLKMLDIEFQKINNDLTGLISSSELEKYQRDLNQEEAKDDWKLILDKINPLNNGKISYEDFLAATVDHKQVLNRKNIKKVFDVYNTDKNHKMSKEELKNCLGECKNLSKKEITRADFIEAIVGLADLGDEVEEQQRELEFKLVTKKNSGKNYKKKSKKSIKG